MIRTLDRVIVALISTAAIAACLAAALIRSTPLPAASGNAWSSLNGAWQNHIAAVTFAVDAVGQPGQLHPLRRGADRLVRGREFIVQGWAFDPQGRQTAQQLLYRVDGGAWHESRYHLQRADVAAYFGLPPIADSGFIVEIPTRTLRAGTHAAELATAVGGVPTIIRIPPIRFDVSET